MNSPQQDAKEVTNKLRSMGDDRLKQRIATSEPVLVAKGLWVFTEGSSLLIVSGYTLYQAHFGNMQHWARYFLTIASVLVLLPAGILLRRFFRRVGESK